MRPERFYDLVVEGAIIPGRLVPADPPPTDTGRNVDHYCLRVDAPDMEALSSWLRAAGVEVLGDPMPRYGARGTGLSVYVLDPDGNIVELKQMPG